MRWRGIALIAVLLTAGLAGCIGGDGEDGRIEAQQTGSELPEAPTFGDALALPQDKGAAEPNIAVLDEDTLFLTAPVGDAEQPNVHEGAAWLWRSTDGGQSWEVLRDPWIADEDTVPDEVPLDGAFCSCDADVVTSPDGWVYYTDWWIAGFAGPGNYVVEASGDGGETWQTSPVSTIRAASVDRQWLVAGEDGFVGLFYFHFDQLAQDESAQGLGRNTLEAVFSHDHGQTWSTPVTVATAEWGTFDQISKPTILPDGTLAMAYGHMTNATTDGYWTEPAEVRVALSEDQGQTWDHVTVAKAPQGFDNLWAVQTASDQAGNLYAAWAARTGETMTTYLAESHDGGQTWAEPIGLRSTGLNLLPWVDALGDGRVAVGWYGTDLTGDPTDAPDNATWYPYVAERADANATFAVTRVSDQPVMEGPLCPLGASCSEDRELLDYVSLAYAPSGQLHYSFARSDTAADGQAVSALVHYTGERVEASG